MESANKRFGDLVEIIDTDEAFKVTSGNEIPEGYWVAMIKILDQYRYYVFEGSVFDTESPIIGHVEKQKFIGENWLAYSGSKIYNNSIPTVHFKEIDGVLKLIEEAKVLSVSF